MYCFLGAAMQANRTILLSILVAGMALASTSFAGGANYTLTSYLSTYVNGSVINASLYNNQAVGASNYVIMQLNGTGNNYVVIRVNPSNYTLVTDKATAFSVLKPYFVANFKINQTLVSELNTSMRQFLAPARYNITDCLVETGLIAPGSSCTVQNACSSCQFSPVCRTILNQGGGVYSPFGYGLVNFSLGYNAYNASYNTYFSAIASLQSGNVGDNVASLGADIANLYNASISLPENPIVAFGNNFDHSLLNGCPQAGNPLSMTWYCQDNLLGDFCGQMNFNYSAFTDVQTAYAQFSSSPITNSSITAISDAAASTADGYLNAHTSAIENATFSAFIVNASAKYNSTVANAQVLLNTYPNASLSASVSELQSIFSSIKGAGPGQNMTQANATLYLAMGNVTALYNQMFAIFGPVSSLSYNNSRSIARAELDYQTVPPNLALVAYAQQKINLELQNGNINSTDASRILSQLKQIGFEARSFYAPITLSAITKGIFGGLAPSFVNPLGINSSVNNLPLTFAIITFVIDIAILGAFYFATYHRLRRANRIRSHRRVRNAWKALFVVLFILVVIDSAAVYTSAASANGFLPFTGFLSTLKGSHVAYIAYNSSTAFNTGTAACVSAINKTLSAQGKSVYILTLANYSCYSSTNASQAGTRCFAPILSSGQPVIMIDNMYGGMAYKGMYGNVFHANSTIASGSGCTLSKVLS